MLNANVRNSINARILTDNTLISHLLLPTSYDKPPLNNFLIALSRKIFENHILAIRSSITPQRNVKIPERKFRRKLLGASAGRPARYVQTLTKHHLHFLHMFRYGVTCDSRV